MYCYDIIIIHMSIITQGGVTALMKASSEGMTEVVTQLVKAGSALDLQNKVCIYIGLVCVCDAVIFTWHI